VFVNACGDGGESLSLHRANSRKGPCDVLRLDVYSTDGDDKVLSKDARPRSVAKLHRLSTHAGNSGACRSSALLWGNRSQPWRVYVRPPTQSSRWGWNTRCSTMGYTLISLQLHGFFYLLTT